MCKWWRIAATVGCAAAMTVSSLAITDENDARVKAIILHSQRLGAHGMGYNHDSLQELAKKLGVSDIPALIKMLKDEDADVSVGAKFGLASQCQAAIDPVRRASDRPNDIRLGEDVLELIETNAACSEQAKQEAETAKTELDEARKAYYQKRAEELTAERENDQRIQANGLKMLDAKRSKELTLEERMEIFQRSVKAAGLENPKTPEQKALVDRMYRTMVLGESDNKKKPN